MYVHSSLGVVAARSCFRLEPVTYTLCITLPTPYLQTIVFQQKRIYKRVRHRRITRADRGGPYGEMFIHEKHDHNYTTPLLTYSQPIPSSQTNTILGKFTFVRSPPPAPYPLPPAVATQITY